MTEFTALAVVALVLVLCVAYAWHKRTSRRRGIPLGTVSDRHAARRRIVGVLLISSSCLLASSCLTTSTPPPTITPAPIVTPAAARIAQVQRVLEATRRVGLVVEQVQAAEIALFRGGQVPGFTAAAHVSIQTAFKQTAGSVIAATSTLAAAVETTDPATVVRALRDGITALSKALQVYSAQLAGWLDTAAALIEVALL